jgi:ankyrin repeat protein
VRLLLEKGASIDKAKDNGATPLLMASQKGHVDTVRLLLEKGASIDKAWNNGTTPLTIARKKGHSEIVHLLELASQV